MQGQSSQVTGTKDQIYNIISVLYHSLQGAETCQIYLQDAQEGDIRSFLEETLSQHRQIAERAKQLLSQHLQSEGGESGSAFGFSPSQSEQPISGQTGGGSGSGQDF